MNMHALNIMMNKATNLVFLDGHLSFLIPSFYLFFFLCLFLSFLSFFCVLFFKTQLFQGKEFHCPHHKHLTCVHHLLDTISWCLMPLNMKARTTCILVMLLSHLTHIHNISRHKTWSTSYPFEQVAIPGVKRLQSNMVDLPVTKLNR
jgi:hypothetical protein